MDRSITERLTVDEVLSVHPRTVSTFLALKTNCVGCHLSRFCTLEDVAKVYALPLDDLLSRLQSCARASPEE
jgi:hybrid cluster-associated redox disulfide protein